MDKITIENLTVYAKHGVFEEEKALGQKFLVSITLYTELRSAGMTDNLGKSVDYGYICHFVDEFMKTHTYNLIEAVAENLAYEILKEISGPMKVDVTISKPWAPIMLPVENVCVTITRQWHTAYLSIGSNMGEREGFLNMAVECLENDERCYVAKVSDYIETKPYGYTEQPDFINGCIELKTLYTPQELLTVCQDIEKKANRERNIKWGPRTLDVDILLYDDEIVSTKELMIPHPQIQFRNFVLEPLSQIAPYVMHPVLNKRVIELLEALD